MNILFGLVSVAPTDLPFLFFSWCVLGVCAGTYSSCLWAKHWVHPRTSFQLFAGCWLTRKTPDWWCFVYPTLKLKFTVKTGKTVWTRVVRITTSFSVAESLMRLVALITHPPSCRCCLPFAQFVFKGLCWMNDKKHEQKNPTHFLTSSDLTGEPCWSHSGLVLWGSSLFSRNPKYGGESSVNSGQCKCEGQWTN